MAATNNPGVQATSTWDIGFCTCRLCPEYRLYLRASCGGVPPHRNHVLKMSPAHLGPGLIWAQPIWAPAHLGLAHLGPAHLGQGPFGPGPNWNMFSVGKYTPTHGC